ncbi:tetratricopeptide repeat protein [bacterium]|nr:tetratricopeptide repeat protein [candidate division CSSED10-310 bacterium]
MKTNKRQMAASNMPKRIGDYRIVELLGEGGMGFVYKGEHTATGQVAAIKIVKLSKPHWLASLRREIRALARIRHPGIVRIIDEGVADDRPWYAMELLRGVTLRRYCADFLWGSSSISTLLGDEYPGASVWNIRHTPLTPSHWLTKIFGTTMEAEVWDDLLADRKAVSLEPVFTKGELKIPAAGGSVEMLLTIIARLCHTLAFMHGEGIIHGDLKPDNVLILPSGMPVIMDFGLMTQMWRHESREDLETENAAGGTLMYISPEQLRGELVDARTDLYALGCILYELVTGRVPFYGYTTAQIVRAKLEFDPPPPGDLVFGLSKTLNDLICNLLQKSPMDRIGHAIDVIDILVKSGADPTLQHGMPDPKPYIYRSKFIGRDREYEALIKCLDQFESGTGGVVFIGGESGVGKTRLLLEFARYARRKKTLVLSGDCSSANLGRGSDERETGKPLAGLKRYLQYVTSEGWQEGNDNLRNVIRKHAQILVHFEPLFKEYSDQTEASNHIDLSPDTARLHLFSALIDILRQLSVNRPVILLLDDLQWADELTLGFLEFALRTGSFKRSKLLVAATFRTEETSDALSRLLKYAGDSRVILNRLSYEALRDIIFQMLSVKRAPPSFINDLILRSEGNPFFVAEYLRLSIGEGYLYRDSTGKWLVSSKWLQTKQRVSRQFLPVSLRDLVARRLNKLSDSARQIVDALAVVGYDAEVILLWALFPLTGDILDAIDELYAKNIVEETPEGKVQFVHAVIREVAYEELTSEALMKIHKRVAEAYESVYPDSLQEYPALLGQHWEQAGNPERARHYYTEAIKNSLKHYAFKEAEKLFTSYLGLLETPTSDGVMMRLRYAISVLYYTGRSEDALRVLNTALHEARKIGDKACECHVLLGLGTIYRSQQKSNEASSMCMQALHLLKDLDDERTEADTLGDLGTIRLQEGDYPEALKYYKRALKKYRKTGDKKFEGITHGNMSIVYGQLEEIPEAWEHYKKAMTISRAMGDRRTECNLLINAANLHKLKDDKNSARKSYQQALVIARDIGDIRAEAVIQINLAKHYREHGYGSEAYRAMKAALDIFLKTNDFEAEADTRFNLGVYFMEEGDPDASREYFDQALGIYESIQAAEKQLEVNIQMARLARRISAASETARSILDDIEKRSDSSMENIRSKVLLERAYLELMQNRDPGALIADIEQCLQRRTGIRSDAADELKVLKKTYEAWREGAELLRGELASALPHKLSKFIKSLRS